MAGVDEVLDMDAADQAAMIRDGQVTSVELVGAALDRIAQRNGELNAVIYSDAERALADAADRDASSDGTLRGVPILIKDLETPRAGEPAYEGTRVLKAVDHRAEADSMIIRRLEQVGCVIVGRTNTPELGATATTEPLSFGPTKNPWNTDHSPGGSSGGSGAAVASGMVALAHGNDGGGSIRIPASACGLVGLKPSRGRISDGVVAEHQDRVEFEDLWLSNTVPGVLTRTVRDTAIGLDALTGNVPGDRYIAPALPGLLVDSLTPPAEPLRIGLCESLFRSESAMDPQASRIVADAGRLAEQLGHHVEPSMPEALSDEGFTERFYSTAMARVSRAIHAIERIVGRKLGDDELDPDIVQVRARGEAVSAIEYLDAQAWLQAWTRRVISWWYRGHDILVTPVLNGPPPRIGALVDGAAGGHIRELVQFTTEFNVTGQPGLSLPLGTSDSGLPIGVQFVAAPGREDLLVHLAAQLESAAPWHHPFAGSD